MTNSQYNSEIIVERLLILLAVVMSTCLIVVAFLPKPGSEAATRVSERIPEDSVDVITKKIEATVEKLKAMLQTKAAQVKLKGGNVPKKGQLEIFLTTVFCMY